MAELDVKTIFEEKIQKNLEIHPEKIKHIDAIYQFKISGPRGGNWTVNVKNQKVTEGIDNDAQCTLECADADFIDIYSGKLQGPQAFILGKLKISGDMGLAMKLQLLFSGS